VNTSRGHLTSKVSAITSTNTSTRKPKVRKQRSICNGDSNTLSYPTETLQSYSYQAFKHSISLPFHLVRKSEIQPLATLILGSGQVVVALLLRQAVPDLVAPRVAPLVVVPDGDYQDHVPGHQAQQDLVADAVERGVGGVVDLEGGCVSILLC
jgi:hypothetical protein